MIPKQIIARSMMFACVLLSACGHSGEENPQPGKPEPEKPVEEENYLTVTTRNGAPVESYEQSFAAFAQTLVVRSNVNGRFRQAMPPRGSMSKRPPRRQPK